MYKDKLAKKSNGKKSKPTHDSLLKPKAAKKESKTGIVRTGY